MRLVIVGWRQPRTRLKQRTTAASAAAKLHLAGDRCAADQRVGIITGFT
jgi:hypothetical protein